MAEWTRKRGKPLTAMSTDTSDRGPVALIVDDEPDIREMLRVSLELKGWTVIQAATGQEAIDRWLESPPDVVVLDHQMPAMSGLECAAKLRELSPDSRIIMFSAYLNPDATEEARRLRILPLRKTDHERLQDLLDLLAEQLSRPSVTSR